MCVWREFAASKADGKPAVKINFSTSCGQKVEFGLGLAEDEDSSGAGPVKSWANRLKRATETSQASICTIAPAADNTPS